MRPIPPQSSVAFLGSAIRQLAEFAFADFMVAALECSTDPVLVEGDKSAFRGAQYGRLPDWAYRQARCYAEQPYCGGGTVG